MLYPLSMLLAAVMNRALDNELTRFAGRHVALAVGGRRFVWRIDGQGRFAAAHPLVDGDCRIECRAGGVQVSGGGELLSALSALWREKDWFAAFSGLFGARLAPVVLHGLERTADALRDAAEESLAAPAAVSAYGDGVGQLHHRTLQVERRAQALFARRRQSDNSDNSSGERRDG